ncbi:unnamed protein product, partial [Closterium sp. NIES-65]
MAAAALKKPAARVIITCSQKESIALVIVVLIINLLLSVPASADHPSWSLSTDGRRVPSDAASARGTELPAAVSESSRADLVTDSDWAPTRSFTFQPLSSSSPSGSYRPSTGGYRPSTGGYRPSTGGYRPSTSAGRRLPVTRDPLLELILPCEEWEGCDWNDVTETGEKLGLEDWRGLGNTLSETDRDDGHQEGLRLRETDGGDEPERSGLGQMGHLRNGDGEGVELSTGKERGLESGEDLESKEESEELEMSGDAGEENAEKDEEAEEEGEEDEAGEEDEEDTIESVFKEIHAWEGEGSSERDGERHIEGERHRARESRGGVFENSQKPGSAERDGERDIEGDRYRARESTGKGESGSREERSRRWKEAISEMRGEWDVKEARGVRGERRGVSGVPKGVRRGGRTGRRRLVDGWMAGLPENTERTAIEKTSRRGRTRRRRRLVDGWVAGPQEKGESAFRWRNEVGDDEEMLTQHHDSYQWQWPVARLGDSWRGMFMREARYDIANTPSCKGILPPPAYTNLPILGRDANETELKILGNVRRHQEKREAIPMDLLVSWAGVGKETRDPIMEGLLESIPRERWLIWAPRFGLGNSLRGYTSAFIFALLSGRRLLRWHGGAHRMVLERLCDAFYCGLDELHYRGDMRKHTKLMEGRELVIHGLNYYSPVMAVNS